MEQKIKLEWEAIQKLINSDVKPNLIQKITLLLNGSDQVPENQKELIFLLLQITREDLENSENKGNKIFQERSLELLFHQLQLNLIRLDSFYQNRKAGIVTKVLKRLTGQSGGSQSKLVENVNKVLQEASDKLNQINDITNKIIQNQNTANNNFDAIQEINQNIKQQKDEIEQEFNEAKSFLDQERNDVEETSSNFSSLLSDCQSKSNELSELTQKREEEFQITKEKIDKQQQEIKEILAGANQAGMAGSFRKRVQELRWPMAGFLVLLFLSASTIIYIGYDIFKEINKETLNWSHLILQRLSIISPLIYFVWFFTQRYNRLALLREKYNFKYTTAMAFEGYKKQIHDSNAPDGDQLFSDLLKISVDIFSDDPTRKEVEKELFKKFKDKSNGLE